MQSVAGASLVNASVQTDSKPVAELDSDLRGFTRFVHDVESIRSRINQLLGGNEAAATKQQSSVEGAGFQSFSGRLVEQVRSVKGYLRESQIKIDIGYEDTLKELSRLNKLLDSGMRNCEALKKQNDRLVTNIREKSAIFEKELSGQREGFQNQKREDGKKLSRLIAALSSQKAEILAFHAEAESYKAKVTEKEGRISYLESRLSEAEANLAIALAESTLRNRELDEREALQEKLGGMLRKERASFEESLISLTAEFKAEKERLGEESLRLDAQRRRLEGGSEVGSSHVTFEGGCLICEEKRYLEIFIPCMHTIVCTPCADTWLSGQHGNYPNKCPGCKQLVSSRKKGIYKRLDLD